jgi:carboxyl-terminal processing protease
MRGLADGLDPDSAYLTAKEVRSVENNEALPEGDVGLELTRQYYLRVIAARDGSPAAKNGLQTGDYVRAIDGKPTRDLSVFEGARLLRGQPGSKVTLTVIRGNAADPHDVALVREKPSAPFVTSKMLAPDTGYVRIVAFRDGVVDELRRHVTEVSKTGAKALVIDVRHTAEGSYDNGIAAARLFVKSGTLVVKGKDKAETGERIDARAGDGQFAMPVVLLVTTGTSGPAEVFAAALDSNERADLVGEHTLGRAGLQKLVKLPENRGLWLTYGRFLTAKGASIHGKGLDPDVAVDEPDVEFGAPAPTEDAILAAGMERLKTKHAA